MVKRKNDTETTNEGITMPTEEVSFPRGGASVLTPLEHREIANKAAKDIFSTKNSSEDNGPVAKKRKATKKKTKDTDEKTNTEKRPTIEDFSFKKLSVGSTVLGCITHINELNVLVSLPNQLTGSVAITEVSDILTNLVEIAAEAEDEEVELPETKDIFYIGQWVQCAVIAAEEVNGRKRIELSLKPSIVNGSIVKVDVTSGLIIGASVESVEDHGYIMSVGINGLAGFCHHDDAKSYIDKYNRGDQLVPGQYIECLVKDVAKNKRTVNLTLDRKAISSARLESPYSKMASITAGQRLNGLVEYSGNRGLKVKFMGLYEAHIGLSYLPFTNDVEETYRVGSTVSFRILFSDMVTEQRLIIGSLLPHVVKLDSGDDESLSELHPYGSFFEKVTVVRVTSIGVLVTIDGLDDIMGFIHISQLSDERIVKLSHKSGDFIVGSTHRARVLSYSPVDGVFSLTTKPSILNNKYFQHSDVTIGEILDVTVSKMISKGLVVNLSSSISGFVPLHHLADVKLSRPEMTFKPGNKVRARVTSVNQEQGKVSLTLKKSLINSELPLIKSLQEVEPKMASHGVIISVKPNGCVIGFYNSVTAFCPSSEMTEAKGVNLVDTFHPGQTVKAYVLKVQPESNNLLVSLIRDTMLTDAERQAKKDKKNNKTTDDKPVEVYKPGSIVDNVEVTDVKHLQLTLKLPNGVIGRVHATEVYDKFEDIPVEERQHALLAFKGKTLKVKILDLHNLKKRSFLVITHHHKTADAYECSLKLDNNNKSQTKRIQIGDQLLGFISDIKADHLVVAVDMHTNGMIRKQHISSDVAIANHPGKHYVVGQAVKVSVLSVNLKKKKLDLVMVDDNSGNVPTAVTDIQSLQVGQVLNGLVQKADAKGGLFVQLANGVTGKVHPTDIDDTFIEHPAKSHKTNKVVKCKVLEVDATRKRIDLSLRPSCINGNDKQIKTFNDIHRGDVLKAYVENITSAGVFIAYSRHIHARVKIAQLSDDFVKDWMSIYTIGQLVESKVLFVDADLKRVEATLKKSLISGSQTAPKKTDEEQIPDVDEDEESEDEPMEGHEESSSEDEQDEDIVMNDSDVDMEEASDDDDDGSEEEQQQEEDDDDKEKVPALSVGSGFDWSGQTAILQSKDEEDNSDSEDDSDNDEKKKKINKKKQVEDKTAELNSAAPQSIGDFERLVVGSPNSSYLWINYMAYQLQLSEIGKARAIGERALKTINFREEQEKMNVWVALMNLENQFGTDATLEQVFKRALTFCDPEKVYLQLIKIYERSEKFNKAEDLWKEATKKFGQSTKVWTMFGLYYLQQGNVEGARELLQKSLKSLPKHKHIETIVKFAQMEFKHGEAERGRTIMEGVMNNSPKRVDLWNVYLDMEIKQGDHDMIQRLFERVTSMKFSSKKMKFLFKKWLQFEKDHGSADGVEHVKERTLAYVESISS
ncbi:uncharacterized protein BX664DRAFT_281445 [Halteromyces radiatus]|uniref:uncharacterized protein n=1 Tax=Halteromyces radiatus TaxID=101107 RepID=UPI0022212926|nr:uncharacterized protein BX664DRAFT_281445 [Halteromyces radiatus]KAI8090037.1 hypothetical protein BX664DRAFT_281445 [Halteromyces radiatus]